uniref:HIT zinc finger containing protein, putative n=1 Tax=Theileria annulata TaxID=5874 RepID=A0A3B0MSG0_THEAN
MNKCYVCDKESKYKCPNCLIKLCSLRCTQEHNKNTQNGCNSSNSISVGIKNKYNIKHIGKDDISNEILLSDCNFLDSVSKKLESTTRFYVNPFILNNTSNRRFIRKHCSEKGINLIFSPLIMKRTKLNKTKIKKGVILWTIEFVYLNNSTFLLHNVDENTKLNQLYKNLKKKKELSPIDSIQLLMKTNPKEGNKLEYTKCNIEETILNNLINRNILDFPTFYVILKNQIESYKIVESTSDHADELEDGEPEVTEGNYDNRLVLESQMGDPVTSIWMGKEGIVAGTALGRVSSYIFNSHIGNPTISSIDKDTTLADDSATTGSSTKTKKAKTKKSLPSNSEVVVVDIDKLESSIDGLKLNSTSPNYDSRDPSSRVVGRYVVYSSYNDECVNGVYISEGKLYTLVGLNNIIIYDIDRYSIHSDVYVNNEISSASPYKNYKQIIQNNNYVLMMCNNTIVLMNLTEVETEGSVLKLTYVDTNVHLENILEFKFPYVVTCKTNTEENNSKCVNIYSIKKTSNNNARSREMYDLALINKIAVDNKQHLVTNCKIWDNTLTVVTDLLILTLYAIHDVDGNIIARKRLSYDILDVNCGENVLLLLKNSQILVLNKKLHVLNKFSILSTFELGWSYNLVNYNNVFCYNSDEGIYIFQL